MKGTVRSKFAINKTVIIIVSVLAAATFLMVFFGYYKQYLYIDETLSYTAANNPGGLSYSLKDRTWYSGADFLRPLTAQDGHRFDYAMVWKNQASDTHPPLYHVILHTICSCFPGRFSKWSGISLNIVSMIIVAVFAYHTGMILFRNNRILAMVGMAAYIVSVSTITQVMFIRMYVLLQVFTSAVIYLHLCKIENRVKHQWKFWAALYLITTAGVMTHYYYIIFAFFLAAGFCIWLLINREWKNIFIYIGTVAASAGTVLMIFPAILTHLFHGEVGKAALKDAMDIYDVRLRIATMFGVINQQIFGDQCKLFIAIAFVFAGVYMFMWIRKKQIKSEVTRLLVMTGKRLRTDWMICLETAALYFITVSLITPYLCDRYLSPIFMIVILTGVGMMYEILQTVLKSDILPYCIAVVLAVTPAAVKINEGLEDNAKLEMLAAAGKYSDVPCVIFDDSVSTDNFMELSKFDQLYYVKDYGQKISIADEKIRNAERLVVCIPSDKEINGYVRTLNACNQNLDKADRLYVGYGITAYIIYFQ